MSEVARRKATYDDLYGIPENTTGQIINGHLIVTPRPSRKHVYATSALGNEIGPPFQFGRGGPGGWVILIEPEIGLGEHTIVPDLAGWKRERFPAEEEQNWISAVPDWICEVLSPGTVRVDRIDKMSIYGLYGVPHLWFVDPINKTLEVFALESSSGAWVVRGLYGESDKVRAEPFQEIEIELIHLWWGSA